MDEAQFTSTERGTVRRTLEGYKAFYPSPLPRQIDYAPSTVLKLNDAVSAISRLAGASRLLPDPEILIGPYIRLEAVLSSRIEGTVTTVQDLLRLEVAPPEREVQEDAREVLNYVRALREEMALLPQLPLSLRLIREVHRVLMTGVRGGHFTPGEFRATQNWIGPPGCTLPGSTYVPPPPDEVLAMMGDLETFLHDRELPDLVALAMAHYQFEAIHPFNDGNGRVGRLLVPLVLAERGVLSWPMLYLSIYFERHRRTYYDLLLRVSTEGDFTPWLDFFLDGVRKQARDAEDRAVRLTDLQAQLRNMLLRTGASVTAIRLAERLLEYPYVSASQVQGMLGVTNPTAQKAIRALEDRDILIELSGQQRYRFWYAPKVFELVYFVENDADVSDTGGAIAPEVTSTGVLTLRCQDCGVVGRHLTMNEARSIEEEHNRERHGGQLRTVLTGDVVSQ